MNIIRTMLEEDWPFVREIYLQGIATGQATFETTAPDWPFWNSSHVQKHRLISESEGRIAGWAALTPVSGRCVYAGVAEVSVYVGEEFRGRKIGQALLQELIKESEKDGYWTLQAGIFEENFASMKLHEQNGFRVIGYRKRLGKMNGVWRDVNFLERRSDVCGVD
jgi:L-amino acid N-acyltransferase YncA